MEAMCRVRVCLPLFYNDGRPIEKNKFKHAKRQILRKWGGFTSTRIRPGEGGWHDASSDRDYIEPIELLEIDIPLEKLTLALEFFDGFGKGLEVAFEQKEVYVTYYPFLLRSKGT